MSARLPVRKTYKLFIGGSFPRSESGRTLELEGHNVARASRNGHRYMPPMKSVGRRTPGKNGLGSVSHPVRNSHPGMRRSAPSTSASVDRTSL